MSELEWVFSIHEFLEVMDKVKTENLNEKTLRALEFDCLYFASKCTISMREERDRLLEHVSMLRKRRDKALVVELIQS